MKILIFIVSASFGANMAFLLACYLNGYDAWIFYLAASIFCGLILIAIFNPRQALCKLLQKWIREPENTDYE